jgi:hypothetical protein
MAIRRLPIKTGLLYLKLVLQRIFASLKALETQGHRFPKKWILIFVIV